MIGGARAAGALSARRQQPRPQGGKVTLMQSAYASLRAMILTGELQPGARLTEIELALRLRISRTPLREALNRLVRDGLVVHESHRGYSVAEFDLKYLEDAFEVRAILDAYAARLAADRITAEDKEKLRSIVERSTAMAAAEDRSIEDLIEEMELGLEIHRIIARASGNEMLVDTLGQILDRCQYFVWLELLWLDEWATARKEHAAIVAAICAGEGARAAELASTHVRGSKQNITRFLTAKTAYQRFLARQSGPDLPRRRSA
ncbi:MAG TPA: GntR family transcriptional regulator [Dongiaceae bacterium]|nr:GntR family transcriptional regulator [Dongiaceae bacterium]